MSLTHTPGRHLARRRQADTAEAAGLWLLLGILLLLGAVVALTL